jgi:hypothetical protein
MGLAELGITIVVGYTATSIELEIRIVFVSALTQPNTLANHPLALSESGNLPKGI